MNDARPLFVTTFSDAEDIVAFVHAGENADHIFGRGVHAPAAAEAFTAGLGGVYARHTLAELSFAAIAAPPHGNLVEATRHLIPQPPMAPVLIEAYVSGFLFGAASAFDTAAFAVNALGFAVAPNEFCSLDDKRGLQEICAAVIAEKHPVKRPGFANHFPRVRDRLIADWTIVQRLLDHHAASKHRTATMSGWASVQSIAFGDMKASQRDFIEGGAKHVRLRAEPRVPYKDRSPHPLLPPGAIGTTPSESLDELVAEWRTALKGLGEALRDDVVDLVARQPTE